MTLEEVVAAAQAIVEAKLDRAVSTLPGQSIGF